MITIEEKISTLNDRVEELESLKLHNKQILNLEEVCLFTHLSKSTIYKYTMSDAIPCYKKAKHLFFDRLEIEAWLKSSGRASS